MAALHDDLLSSIIRLARRMTPDQQVRLIDAMADELSFSTGADEIYRGLDTIREDIADEGYMAPVWRTIAAASAVRDVMDRSARL